MAANHEVTCDKCGQTSPHPSRYQMTCNRHIASEKTGYCTGTLRPSGQFTPGTPIPVWVAPPPGTKDSFRNR